MGDHVADPCTYYDCEYPDTVHVGVIGTAFFFRLQSIINEESANVFFRMKTFDKNRPNEFQNSGEKESWKEKSNFLKRNSAFPKNYRGGVVEESVGNTMAQVKGTKENKL